jgi:adenine-specific DNA-methyltransferase
MASNGVFTCPPVTIKEAHEANKSDLLHSTIYHGRVQDLLSSLPKKPMFDLVITSPPYNIGKSYERERKTLSKYFLDQRHIIEQLVARIEKTGSICWQVGNYIEGNEIVPLDLEFHKIFRKLGLKLRNRIVWHFGHGLHARRRFSARYEMILWYTLSDKYVFNLDDVRIPSKYPGKTYYKGDKRGKFSGNPLGKNPEDVWDIPNVKSNHVEKTQHPCQFPVGLVERLVLALTNKGALVFDPFMGVASAGVAALHHGRRFSGCDTNGRFVRTAAKRLNRTLAGDEDFRPHDRAIYDHTKSRLSIHPRLLAAE